MNTHKRHLIIIAALVGWACTAYGQSRFTMDLKYGNIQFTDSKVTYYNSSNVLQTHDRVSGETYQINQTDANTVTRNTIAVGTKNTYGYDSSVGIETLGTPVTVETVIYLNGVNIEVNTEDDVPIMVNNSADVYLILMNGTTNYAKLEYSGTNNRAGVEKELNSTGNLVITCETGYTAYRADHTDGHACTSNGTCGKLYAYANKAGSGGGNGANGAQGSSQGGAGIGSVGSGITKGGSGLYCGEHNNATGVTSHTRALKNLIIAGGVITAKGATNGGKEDGGGAGIGVGSGPQPTQISGERFYTGAAIENLCITGGYITAIGGNGADACIGGGFRSNDVEVNIYGGTVIATDRWNTAANTKIKSAGIGTGSGGSDSGGCGRATISIYGGTVTAWGKYGAAIGTAAGGAGGNEAFGYCTTLPATISISGGTINATTSDVGAAIGSGGLWGSGDYVLNTGTATINISGGIIVASSGNSADIGSGGVIRNSSTCYAGQANITVTGDEVISITANSGGMGGGMAYSGTGGHAIVSIDAPNATIHAASIGGGNSTLGNGGNATMTVEAGEIEITGTVGGGNSTSDGTQHVDPEDPESALIPMTTGNGGTADLTLTGGSLTVTGKVGGGKSFGSGNGGNASIHVTGGTLDCAKIGGGDSNTGNPGEVSHADDASGNPVAGIWIEGGTLVSGSIGGGINAGGKIGKATVHIEGGLTQGQFILAQSPSSSANHCYFKMEDGIIDNSSLGAVGAALYPRSQVHGGAVFLEDAYGEVNISGGTIRHCTGSTYGGAVYMNTGSTGTARFDMSGGSIQNNSAEAGGGLFITSGTVNITGGEIVNNAATGTAASPSGRGGGIAIYGAAGVSATVIFKSATLSNNTAGVNGGGMYVSNGTITIGRNNSSSPDAIIAGNRCNGDGIHSNGGRGGALCIANLEATVDISHAQIGVEGNGNYANDMGGGLFVEGTVTLGEDAKIQYNTANRYGGGVLLRNVATAPEPGGSITLTGSAVVSDNNVVNGTAGKGGGIFIEENCSLVLGTGTMSVRDNTVNGVPNNTYLLPGQTISVTGFFNPQYMGIFTENTTPDIPVFTGTKANLEPIYNGMVAGTKSIYDDRQLFSAKYTSADYTTLFFGSNPWSPLQQTVTKAADLDPILHGGLYEISNVKQLTAFLCYVNGISPTSTSFGSGDPTADGKLMADINMEGHYWVPIEGYEGNFDGNGYTISNLTMVPSNPSTGRGMFGNTSGTIENVILRHCYFGSKVVDATNYLGGIAAQNSGTARNNVVDGTLYASNNYCIMGGIAGQNTGTVHSTFASPLMEGYQMGGLVGENTGNLYNSFANASFDYKGSSKYFGGLVGVNTGRVENCYVRVHGTTPSGACFGYLAGNNTSTANKGLYYCYSPNSTYVSSSGTQGNKTGLDTYTATSLPYLYNHADNLVSGTDKPLLATLNKWVKDNGSTTYTSWLRPWQKDNASKFINDDLPLLRMPATNAVAATNGMAYLDYNQVNDLLTGYTTSTEAIFLYGIEDDMATNSGSSAELYIDQDALLIPASSSTVITGHTSQTLCTYENATPTAGNRWHNFSSPLKQSYIGISYSNNDEVAFSWDPDPCGVLFSDNDDQALFPSDIAVANMDLYSFYEPEYHWINFRRNSNSHWHENDHGWKINYNGNGIQPIDPDDPNDPSNGNEAYLVPGKGYLVSIDVDQLVQNKGELNNGNVYLYNVTRTDYNAWAERLGFHLLGNPYQSYLDFEAFITENGSCLWSGDGEYTNTYACYDPSQKSYVQYKYDVSYGALTASQYIHPHQGFFIRKTAPESEGTMVTYTNDMRTNDAQSTFRGGNQPAYPLINLMVRDSEGNGDVAVLELDRDTDEGAEKMRLGECKGLLSLGYEGKDYGILFRSKVGEYQSLHFTAREEGTFTLTWEPMNGEFSELTLVDNIAGTHTDMVSCDSYVFEGNPDQYASRFKIVIGDYKDIEEHDENGSSTGSVTFAFQTGNEIVVNGEGRLEVIDMLGRIVGTEQLQGSQSTVRKPETAGVYVLRLTGRDGVRTQKIVIR